MRMQKHRLMMSFQAPKFPLRCLAHTSHLAVAQRRVSPYHRSGELLSVVGY
jgi:hypothetical protein